MQLTVNNDVIMWQTFPMLFDSCNRLCLQTSIVSNGSTCTCTYSATIYNGNYLNKESFLRFLCDNECAVSICLLFGFRMCVVRFYFQLLYHESLIMESFSALLLFQMKSNIQRKCEQNQVKYLSGKNSFSFFFLFSLFVSGSIVSIMKEHIYCIYVWMCVMYVE